METRETKKTGDVSKTAIQTTAAKPSTTHSTVTSATTNRKPGQETANMSPPATQGFPPGGANQSDGR